MRYASVALCALAFIISCAAKPKVVSRALAPSPAPSVRLKAGGPAVAYALPDGWRITPSKDPTDPVILVHPPNKDEAVALLLQETAFDETVETATTRWAMMAATMPNSFHATGISQPSYPSDEESSFTVDGLDDAKRPMLLTCRIRHVGSNVADFWAIVMLTGSSADAAELKEVGDKLVKSLKVQAQTSPQ